MNATLPSFVLGYHGCDRKVADAVFAGKAVLTPSHNDYDWLGDGIYFWEHNAQGAKKGSLLIFQEQKKGSLLIFQEHVGPAPRADLFAPPPTAYKNS